MAIFDIFTFIFSYETLIRIKFDPSGLINNKLALV